MRDQFGAESTAKRTNARKRLAHGGFAVLLIVLVFLVSSAAVSANNGMTQVSGVGNLDILSLCTTTFPETDHRPADYAAVLDGDLYGCLYVYIDFDRTTCSPGGVYNEVGLEIYDINGGNLDMFGTFASEYRYTGKFDDCNTLENQKFGRCQHPVQVGSGTEDFAGLTGRLDFKDDVDEGCSYYRGHLRLP